MIQQVNNNMIQYGSICVLLFNNNNLERTEHKYPDARDQYQRILSAVTKLQESQVSFLSG
jgi:hypothetical protein